MLLRVSGKSCYFLMILNCIYPVNPITAILWFIYIHISLLLNVYVCIPTSLGNCKQFSGKLFIIPQYYCGLQSSFACEKFDLAELLRLWVFPFCGFNKNHFDILGNKFVFLKRVKWEKHYWKLQAICTLIFKVIVWILFICCLAESWMIKSIPLMPVPSVWSWSQQQISLV